MLTVIHHFLLLNLVFVSLEQAAQRVADLVHDALASSFQPRELIGLLHQGI